MRWSDDPGFAPLRLLLPLMLLLAGVGGPVRRASAADADADPDVARWFNRHPDARWRELAAQWETARAAMTEPVQNLILPLDTHPSGRLRAVLRAARAQMLDGGMIIAEEVRIDLYDEAGQPDGWLTASGCLYDRNQKDGFSPGEVRIMKGSDRLKGRGLYFSITDEYLKLLAECEIRTQRIPARLGRLL